MTVAPVLDALLELVGLLARLAVPDAGDGLRDLAIASDKRLAEL